MSIHEMLDVQDEYLLSLVPDYKVNLIAPYDMEEKSLKKFQSSLREVFQFIKYSEDKEKMKEIVTENERYREMDPKAVSLLNSCTKVEIKIEEEEEKVNMCKAWDDMAKECEERGRVKGEDRHIQLTNLLLEASRYEDLKKAGKDGQYREYLYQEFGL